MHVCLPKLMHTPVVFETGNFYGLKFKVCEMKKLKKAQL